MSLEPEHWVSCSSAEGVGDPSGSGQQSDRSGGGSGELPPGLGRQGSESSSDSGRSAALMQDGEEEEEAEAHTRRERERLAAGAGNSGQRSFTG